MTNFISKDLAVKIAKQVALTSAHKNLAGIFFFFFLRKKYYFKYTQTINIRGEGDQTYAQLSGK
jgi:hypothetical protein